MKTCTFKELGTKLPIGQLTNGQLIKDFTLRPYKGRVDRHLAIWREANEGKNMAYLAAKYLSLIVSSAGGEALSLTADGDSTGEQIFKVSDWYFADAIYLYIYSRIVNVSEWIEIPYRCPKCKTSGIVKADLWSSEVRVIESPADLYTWVTLQDGLKIVDVQKPIKRIKLQPIRFRAMFQAGASQAEMGSLTYMQLRESIVELEGAPAGYIVQDNELDELTKKDLLRIDRQTSAVTAGPDLRTTVECQKKDCGLKIRDALNWAFDPFFDSSVPLVALES